ncbi:MAG: peptide chain release factor-like protein [Deltaproteobacteria bacterium]|nr:peptide chain release factor-like protein [Deltaproteobacteria bacterium]MBM4351565.1 peptide chain release factor-like protein [Deltaproteobacteria bacterium]
MIKPAQQKFDTHLDLLKKQVVVETYRSSGPGGQRKNKTETAVRLKHPPSGITVTATEHRFQSHNLRLALERLQKQLLKLNRPTKKRRPTSVPLKAKERRIEERKIRSKKKLFRQSPSLDRNHME